MLQSAQFSRTTKNGEKRPPMTGSVVQEFEEACYSASECGPSEKQSRADVETRDLLKFDSFTNIS